MTAAPTTDTPLRPDRVTVAPFDFRATGAIAKELVRRLELLHEVFSRALGNELSNALRSLVRIELMSVDQVSYDEYVRSAPNPTVLCSMATPPLAGTVLVEMSTQMALNLVDRLLGGNGASTVVRRPTALETSIIEDLLQMFVEPVRQTLEPLIEVEPALGGIEYNPHFLQAANPSDTMTILSFSLSIVQGVRAEGLLTVAYPPPVVDAITERADAAVADDRLPALEAGIPDSPVAERLVDAPVTLRVELRPTAVAAAQIVELRPGDVLTLDHRVDEEVVGRVAEMEILRGRIGRNGKNLALQLTQWSAR